MILYRADRIPPAHVERFASLILDPPEPVTVPLTLTATLVAARATDLPLPAGIRFATNFEMDPITGVGRRFLFETITPAIIKQPVVLPDDLTQVVTVTAREYLEVQNETLGTSDGTPNQVFPFRPIHTSVCLPLDRPTPVLLDFVNRSPTYEPNPQVTVGGTAWELRRFLQTDQSYIDPTAPVAKQHYMVDADANCVRFGDGLFGSIPAAGTQIVCTRYRILQGPDALIAAGDVVHQLDSVALLAGEAIAFTNGDAEGGDYFFRPDERIREGLTRFRRPARLISASDFEQVVLVDFNELQRRARKPATAPLILRAIVLMNRKPSAPDQPAAGHVTIAVLPEPPGVDLDASLTDPAVPDASKASLIVPSTALLDKLRRVLDKRRLITTRIHLASPPLVSLPTLTPISITTTVIVDRDRSIAEMTTLITNRLRALLGVVHGGFDGTGWPMGGSVYRSKLFRLLEDVEGVDHVESLTLSPADVNGDVILNPLSLPSIAFGGLAVTVVRA
jgi:hypothetical protein